MRPHRPLASHQSSSVVSQPMPARRRLRLAEVERRVQRLADIVDDIGPLDLVLTGQRVDADLGAGGSVGEVIEWTPPPFGATPVDLRGL